MTGKEADRLKFFIRALGKTERYVLLLFYADDLTPTEIGWVLDLPEPRVVAILNGMRRRLEVCLGHQQGLPMGARLFS